MLSATEVPGFQPVICACTVATAAELPAVKVLSSSFLAEHPEGRFLALIVDAQPEASGPGLVTPADLGVGADELHVLATSLSSEELRSALVPRLLEQLLAQGLPVLYLDPWVQVFGSVTKLVLEALKKAPVALLPRTLRPLPDDGLQPGPTELHDFGAFDPGFIAVGPGAEPYLGSLDMPALVPHQVLRDARLGLSVWNVADRPLHRDDEGVLTVLGSELLTVHFAGFDPRRPWLLSAEFSERPRVLLSEHPLVAELVTGYRGELVRCGHTMQQVPYRFGQLIDGTDLPDELRADYRAASPTPPPAFGDDGGAGFLLWACEQTPNGGTRWSEAVWRTDELLRAQFPAPFGADAEAFREWCAGVGVTSGRLPVPAVPGPRAEGPALLDQLGVSVIGSGPLVDLVLAAARASGLPTSTTANYPVVVRAGDDEIPDGRFVVDVALDASPRDPRTGVNELWVSSEATRATAERIGGPIVRVVPLPVHDIGERTHETGPEIVFAALADHAIDRAGNVLGVVSAFLSAFPDRADVRLRIAVTGADDHPEAAERLRLATAADPRIELVEDGDVVSDADCVVSLHRGGAGDRIAHRLAELAVRGIPVLASDSGAVAELFGKTAVLVPCHQGGAEPDVQAAARLLHSLADDLPTAAALGHAARDHVLHTRSVSRVGELLRERVEHAYRGWRARRPKPAPEVDPMKALQSAKHALLRQPDVGSAHRTPMAPALRKVVLRALDHYDNHMREVLHTLVDGVERTVSELVDRQDALRSGVGTGELELLRAELEQVAERQDHFGDQIVGVDDGVVRVRADMAGQGRRLREIEDAVVAEAAKRAKQSEGLAARIDKLTVALNRTLDRIDTLESKVVEVFKERDTRLDAAVRAANQAQQTADALRRVVVRSHERAAAESVPDVRSSLVLCDAGMVRLPADDMFMLPLLSSNGVWESELSELIDSLVEPDGVFLDVGAYVGYHSIRVLSRLGVSGAVVAVEPSAAAAALLRHNVEVNVPAPVAARLSVIEGAAWESQGELACSPTLTGGLSVSPLPEDAPEDAAKVRAVRLDKELEELAAVQGMKLSVVRVDTPGRGHRALAGLVRLLRRDKPHVLLEFSATGTTELGDDPVTVLKEFGIWGYDLVPVATRQAASPEQIVKAMEGLRSITLWLRPRTPGPKPAVAQPAVPVRQAADQPI